MAGKLKIIAHCRDQRGHLRPVEELMGGRAEFVHVGEFDRSAAEALVPDILVTVTEFQYDAAKWISWCRERGIPSLNLQDGILEWRCQYENPLFASGDGAPQHQPVLADKIACIGPASARFIAGWSGPGKVEVTGMPRLDRMMEKEFSKPSRPGSRVLIVTAKNPGFTREQRDVALKEMRDVRDAIAGMKGVTPLWRLTGGLDREIGVENSCGMKSQKPLHEILDEVDAVITTTSTVMLEAFIAGRPTAVIDYHNDPRFWSSAFVMSSREQVDTVLGEMLEPSASRMDFQETVMRDQLLLGRASERVAALIEAMAAVPGSAGKGVVLPVNMSSYDPFMRGRAKLPELRELYPAREAFRVSGTEELKAMLARAESEIASLRRELGKRTLASVCSGWLDRAGRKLSSMLKRTPPGGGA